MRILSLLLVLAIGSAHAQTRPMVRQGISVPHNVNVELYGPITTTPISGNSGYTSISIAPSEPQYYLRSLEFTEAADDPCFMRARFLALQPGGTEFEQSASTFARFCGTDNTGNSGSRESLFGSSPTPIEGYTSFAAIHGIEMCSNDRNENNYKLKGVRVFGTHLNADGRADILRDPSFGDDFARTNCRKWEGPQRCPAGSVAVGVNVHSRSNSITGLALRCQAIRLTPVPG